MFRKDIKIRPPGFLKNYAQPPCLMASKIQICHPIVITVTLKGIFQYNPIVVKYDYVKFLGWLSLSFLKYDFWIDF